MEKIIVDVAWCDKNFGGSLGSNVPGAVVFTAPTFEALQKEAKDSLEFHVEGLLENGEEVPGWLKNGDYEFVYNYQDATTLLKAYSPYVSLAAISRASGINQSLLSHYVNGLKKPREQQRKRIVDGLHKIGSDLQSVNFAKRMLEECGQASVLSFGTFSLPFHTIIPLLSMPFQINSLSLPPENN